MTIACGQLREEALLQRRVQRRAAGDDDEQRRQVVACPSPSRAGRRAAAEGVADDQQDVDLLALDGAPDVVGSSRRCRPGSRRVAAVHRVERDPVAGAVHERRRRAARGRRRCPSPRRPPARGSPTLAVARPAAAQRDRRRCRPGATARPWACRSCRRCRGCRGRRALVARRRRVGDAAASASSYHRARQQVARSSSSTWSSTVERGQVGQHLGERRREREW
jgi:hypothetical protein